ncbi:pirin family protein [Intrasporangium sp.]|uniref:pirin family protein n=1 Tax=Intrasporangium sp. TaxID=1925024 RepID=UPI00293962F7|nr:pirin family protein [Intrasporangium sp.]MDV3220180.1 pirin family protein [Intrasporangium sp.]
MSNPERNPAEVVCDGRQEASGRGAAVVLPYRNVPLGGPRAMPVRRSLPQRERSLIGAWCFVDHYGPDDVSETGGMKVPGHPHTGLQTVSWLFTGEVEHRDTTGAHAMVRPGQLNIMTAGSGIAHSEYSTEGTTVLHGAQLWVALPDEHRFAPAAFEHYEPPPIDVEGARVLVFLGTLFGETSPVSMFSDLVGAEINLPPGQRLEVPVDPAHEHGVLCDTGTLTMGAAVAKPGEIAFQPLGAERLTLEASPSEPTRVLLLGGAPLGEQIVMWWNFIGRTHDEVVRFRDAWHRERETGGGVQFGAFPDAWPDTLPAPELPNVRLRTRG